jgi:hypothetical protein
MDDTCQQRLADMGFCRIGADGRYRISTDGQRRHANEVLKTGAEVDRQ